MSTFAYFLTAIAKILFLERRLGAWLFLHRNFRFFYYSLISKDPKSYVCCTRYQVSLYWYQTGPVLKHCRGLKSFDKNCRKNFFFTLKDFSVLEISIIRILDIYFLWRDEIPTHKTRNTFFWTTWELSTVS